MYYLVDTSPRNGCLRAIPGSHLKRHPLHSLDRKAHQDDEVKRAVNMNHPALQPAEDEIDVPVKAGDVVIGDSRLLHSAHANQTDERRTVLTIWYWLAYGSLPEDVRALIAQHITDSTEWSEWVEQTRSITGRLIPVSESDVEPVPSNNFPGTDLR